MWIKTTDGDLVNLDHLVRVGRYGGDGMTALYAMGANGPLLVGLIDEATWHKLVAEHDIPVARKKP